MEEFLILARCLEPEELPENKAIKLFNNLSDNQRIEDNESKRVISFNRFAIGCVDRGLFSLDSQIQFLKAIDISECILQLNAIKPKENATKLIEERFKKVGKYTDYYKSWVEPIKKALKEDYSKNANIVLIKLKLIDAESIHVYTKYFYSLYKI